MAACGPMKLGSPTTLLASSSLLRKPDIRAGNDGKLVPEVTSTVLGPEATDTREIANQLHHVLVRNLH